MRLLLLVGLMAAAPLSALAQQPTKPPAHGVTVCDPLKSTQCANVNPSGALATGTQPTTPPANAVTICDPVNSTQCLNVAPNGSISGGGATALALTHGGVRQAWIGDSRQFSFAGVEGNGETRIQARSYGAWAEAFSGCRLLFDARYVWGYSGQTAQYELTQYPTTVALNYPNFDMLFIESPGNNIDGTSNLFDPGGAIQADIAMASMALANGKLVALMGMQPNNKGVAAQNLQISQYNQWAQSYANATPGVYFINVYADLANPDGTTIAAYYQDALHVNGRGAFVIGERINSTLAPLLANTRTLFTPAPSGYNATLAPFGNLQTNPALTGTAGTKASFAGTAGIIAGTVPTNWDVSRIEGTAAGLVMSQTAQTTGFGAVNSTATATMTITSDAAVAESFQFAGLPFVALTRSGVLLQDVIQVDYSNVTGLAALSWTNDIFGTGPSQRWVEFESGEADPAYPFPSSGSLCFKTPVATVPAGDTQQSSQLYIMFNPSLTGNAAGGTFKIHDPNLYYLN